MNVKEQKFGEIILMSIEGRLDTTTYGMLEVRLLEIIDGGQIRIVMDCSEMDYISSSGLRVFLMGLKKITPLKGRFILANLPEAVREIMEIAGFNTIFEIYKTREEAISAVENHR
jgi:anti-sigma B factor antagonist